MINNTLTCAYHQPSCSPRPRQRRARVHHSTTSTSSTTVTTPSTTTAAAATSVAASAIAAATAAITTGVPSTVAKPSMSKRAPVKVVRELPQQDYQSIHEAILAKYSHGQLPPKMRFVDPIFPPDQSSLTYVYSGDDKYERMLFKRPLELVPNPIMADTTCDALVRQAMRRWGGRQWLTYALAVVSVNPSYMERLIVGHRQREQGFSNTYTGAFHFELWRFGEWVRVVVDDCLPVLDGRLAFCPSYGNPHQFWPALLEKAYAKCNRAYEAIEVGNPLSALTDFTGAICEHFTPPEEVAASCGEFFHLLYRSSVNRSLIAVWRSPHSFRESTIRSGSTSPNSSGSTFGSAWSNENLGNIMMHGPILFLLTAVTKFPLRDGRMLEMVRVKCPHSPPSTWWGDFSLKNDSCWHRVNPAFLEKYRPRECLEGNEFWMPFLEFCRHFGDLVICSSTQPYKRFDRVVEEGNSSLSDSDKDSQSVSESGGRTTEGSQNVSPSSRKLDSHSGFGIKVQENTATIKMDTRKLDGEDESLALFIRRASYISQSHQQLPQQPSSTVKKDLEAVTPIGRPTCSESGGIISGATFGRAALPNPVNSEEIQQQQQQQQHRPQRTHGQQYQTPSQQKCQPDSIHSLLDDGNESVVNNTTQSGSGTGPTDIQRDESVASSLSNLSNSSLSDTESTNSASEIKIRLKSSHGRGHADRPSTAPAKPPPHRISKTFNMSMFDARMDHFQSKGSWGMVVRYFGRWDKMTSGGPLCDLDSHSRNPRVPFTMYRADSVNEIVPAALHDKCHVIVSLMQDYRPGAKTANSLLVNIGFCIYKSRIPEKDEKRHLSKLQVVRDVTSANESREITARLDLDPGHYLLVPYTYQVAQEGDFLVRIMAEKDQMAGKTGCAVS